jgi:hypothetical protein
MDVAQTDGTTIVVALPSGMTNVAETASRTIVAQLNANPHPAGKSNMQKKRKKDNHKRNVKARLSGTTIVAQAAGTSNDMPPVSTTNVSPPAQGAAADKDNTLLDDAVRQLGRLLARRRTAVKADYQQPTSNEQLATSDDQRKTIDHLRLFADNQ